MSGNEEKAKQKIGKNPAKNHGAATDGVAERRNCLKMAAPSTREKLIGIIDDIDLITRELLESLLGPKNQKMVASDHAHLIDLLLVKDKEYKDTLKEAEIQAEIQKKMDAIQVEVDKCNQEIRNLQKNLKEIEHMLATAIYQAKQKLQTISNANKQPISSEDLIKYAHRISASNAVAAPITWQQGDPRRPYPTDMEMRMGFLARIGDPSMNGMLSQQPVMLPDVLGRTTTHPEPPPTSQVGGFTWHASSEMLPSISSTSAHGTVHIVTKGSNKENEDVEVMSSDSSSSSSSDSQ